ncbi:MAG: NUDIX domain-containing protein [Pseudomonadota bacterium]
MARIKFPRLSVRAVIVEHGKLLLVNAYPGNASDLWCAPGGGVEANQSLPDNARREVFEELGVEIEVRGLLGVNEFHAPDGSFHQVDLFFRAQLIGEMPSTWSDVDGVVNRAAWVAEADLPSYRHKPDTLGHMAFHGGEGVPYDPLETIVS